MVLHLYILRQLLVSLLFSTGGLFTFILFPVMLHASVKLPGISMLRLLQYSQLVLIDAIPHVVPLSFLLAVVATYGRMANDNEILAIKMAGWNPLGLLRAGLVLAVLLCLSTSWLLAEVSPQFQFLQRSFLRNAELELFQSVARHATRFDCGDFYLHAATRRDDVLADVVIGAPQGDGRELLIVADSAALTFEDEHFLVLRLQNAEALVDDIILRSENPSLRLDLNLINPIRPFTSPRPKYIPSGKLRAAIREGSLDHRTKEGYRYEIHRRWALSATYLLFLFLGVPTGILLRTSNHLGAFAAATFYGFLYYLLAFRLGQELSDMRQVPAVVAAWSPYLVFAAIGTVFARIALWR